MKSDVIPATDDDIQTPAGIGTSTTGKIINNQSSGGIDGVNETKSVTELLKYLNHSPSNITYFNNAGKVPIPPSVQQAGLIAVHQEANPWTEHDTSTSDNETLKLPLSLSLLPSSSSPPQFRSNSEITHETRSLFAKLIGADASDIAITPSTGFALTMVARNLNLTQCVLPQHADSGLGEVKGTTESKKSQILILQDEMSSEVYCWQEELCKSKRCEFVIVPHPTKEEENWTTLIMDRLTDDQENNIKVVCLPQVHWSDGSYIDLKCIGKECKKRNIIFVVDGTQSVGICPLNVKEIQCHVLAASVHKWLLGPHGQSLVYVHPQFHDTWLPLDRHERSRVVFQHEVYDAAENNIGPNGYPDAFVAGAARLDSGGKKNPILLSMVCEGLRIVNQINKMEAQKYLKSLTDEILIGGVKIGFGVQPGPRAGHIIGLRPKSPKLLNLLTPERMVEIATNLKQRGVYLAVRCGAFRIAPYLDTTMDDVDKLLKALQEECNDL